MTGKLITGTLVGTVVMMVVGFLWYGLLPIGSSSFQGLPNSEAVVAAVKAGNLKTGTYQYPYVSHETLSNDEQAKEEFVKLHASGPMFEVRYHAEGVDLMAGGMFVQGFFHFLVSAIIAVFILRMALPLLTTYGRRLGFFIALGLFAGLYTNLAGPIWMFYPWDRAIMDMLASVVNWTIAGAAMAAIIKPAAPETARTHADHRSTVAAVN